MPTKEDLFSDARSYTEHGERLEGLKSALGKSIERHDKGVDRFLPAAAAKQAGVNPGIQRGLESDADQARLLEIAERFSQITKGLSGDESAAVQADLNSLREMRDSFSKDITVSVPGDLHPYDLETPAKMLVPRFSPLRNRISRTRAQGTAREYRRILGFSNAGMGGVPDVSPFFNSETALNNGPTDSLPKFGALSLIRGQKISYAMDVKTQGHVEMSLSDVVGWKGQFSNLGFQDNRQLSQMALLWAHLLSEEKAILYGRGASNAGFSGAVTAPVVAATANAVTGAQLDSGTYYAVVTARSGFGESVVSAEVSQAVDTGQGLTINVTSEPAGALGYNLYLGTSAGQETFAQAFVGNSVTVTGFATGGAAVPTADTSADPYAYDGYLTVLSDPAQSGYVSRLNAPLWDGTTGEGDKPFQDAFASLYASVYADPEEIWFGAPQRRELSDWIKTNNSSSAYRLLLNQGEFESGTHVAGLVTGIVNESSPSGRIVDLNVHPYMPPGAAFVNSRVLPIPDSHIGETAEMLEVQGYMSVDWPQIQFTYDASTYWYGSMIHYAPRWSGAILGIQ